MQHGGRREIHVLGRPRRGRARQISRCREGAVSRDPVAGAGWRLGRALLRQGGSASMLQHRLWSTRRVGPSPLASVLGALALVDGRRPLEGPVVLLGDER
eukprot:2238766-Pleurochrysis_carterae.AAC.1